MLSLTLSQSTADLLALGSIRVLLPGLQSTPALKDTLTWPIYICFVFVNEEYRHSQPISYTYEENISAQSISGQRSIRLHVTEGDKI